MVYWSWQTRFCGTTAPASKKGEFDQIEISGEATLILDYSCVMGYDTLGSNHALGGVGNHGLDPRFVDVLGPDLGTGTGDEDLGLGPDSPCADAADNGRLFPDRMDVDGDGDRNETLPTDLAGAPRRADDEVVDTGIGKPPIVDMGALERKEDS